MSNSHWTAAQVAQAKAKKYKRDRTGKFAKTNTLVAKIAMAKAQGVKHTEPGSVPKNKLPKGWHTIKNIEAKALGKQLYDAKKSGKFQDDGQIFKAANKLATDFKKKHPTTGNGLSANMVVAAYKQHEYDETGDVKLLGEVLGKLDSNGAKGSPAPTAKPKVDEGKSGLSLVSSDKFSKPGELKPTGKVLGGVTGAKVYKDDKGAEWVVKAPKGGSNAYSNSNFLVDIEIAASRIQNKAGLTVPAMHAEVVDGKTSAVSKMYQGALPAFEDANGTTNISLDKMSAETILGVQKQQVLDWLISNHDSHSGNFLATEKGIVGIDKGQSFKFFGKDKLDYNYIPVSPLDGNKPVYQTIWRQYAEGKGEIFDPSKGELNGTIQRLQGIPDDEYKKLLAPYAEKASASGQLSAPSVDAFLKQAVARKNNLQKDFDDYYAKVKAQHEANKPKPKAEGSLGAQAAAEQVVGFLNGDISYTEGLQKLNELAAKEIITDLEWEKFSKDMDTAEASGLAKPKTNASNKSEVLKQDTANKIGNQEGFDGGYSKSYSGDLKSGDIIYNYFAPDNHTYKVKIDSTQDQPGGKEATGTIIEGPDGGGEPVHMQQNADGTWFDTDDPDDGGTFVAGPSSNFGSISDEELGGTKVGSLGDVIPGDKLVYKGQNVTVASVTPMSVKFKKDKTNGIGVMGKLAFENGLVSYQKSNTSEANNFDKPHEGNLVAGQKVLVKYNDGEDVASGEVAMVNGDKAYIKIDNDPEGDWVEWHKIGPNGTWIDSPEPWGGSGDTLGLPGDGSPAAASTAAGKAPGSVVQNINDLVPGDFIKYKGENLKVTSNDGDKVQTFDLDSGTASWVFYPHEFGEQLNSNNFEIKHGEKSEGATTPTLPTPQPTAPKSVATSTTTTLPPTSMSPSEAKPLVAATWDNLTSGSYYHIPNGKQQQVVNKTATTVTVKSTASGNEYTHDKDKFEKYLADKDVKFGLKPPVLPGQGQPPVYADQVSVGMSFQSSGYNPQTYKIFDVVEGKSVAIKDSQGNSKAYGWEEFSGNTAGWQLIKPKSPWEEYALGNISWEEYKTVTGVDDSSPKKLHSVEGPEPPPPAISTKETKQPPPWSKIPHPAAKTIGKAIYDRKRAGEFENDHAMWLAIGKELNKYKKSNPHEATGLSQNMIRNAARRLEFDDKGFVSWTTTQQKTAQVVTENVVASDLKSHNPQIQRENDGKANIPLTAYGDNSASTGGYLNPHVFTVEDSSQWKSYGLLLTEQNESLWPSGQLSAMKKFTAGGYAEMNDWLRKGGSASQFGTSSTTLAQRVSNLKAAFKNRKIVKPTKDWLIVTRGSGAFDVGIEQHSTNLETLKGQVGKTVVNKAFLSTSITDRPKFGGQIRTVFRLPPGFPGLYVDGKPSGGYGDGLSSTPGEREVILPAGLEYKIISVDNSTSSSHTFDVVVEVTGGYQEYL